MTGKTAVVFGAGNIGRSFIGQIFSRNGFEVVFIDVNDRLVELLNERRAYDVVIKRNDQPDETMTIRNVRAVNGRDTARAAAEAAGAGYIATAVGPAALMHVIPTIAEAIKLRFGPESPRHEQSVDIILAENLRNAASHVKAALEKRLPRNFPIASRIGLVETSIGKMVPIMRREDLDTDPLRLFAEEYNTLIVDGKGFKCGIPQFPEIMAVHNIAAYVDRKLFVHNLGHAAAAYLGFVRHPERHTIWEMLEDPAIRAGARKAMEQAAAALAAEYPTDLSRRNLQEHIEDLLERFANRALGDTVFRVGRDLARKLSRDDRIIGAIRLAWKHGLPFDAIAEVFHAALAFDARDEAGKRFPEDDTFIRETVSHGPEYVLTMGSWLDPENRVERELIAGILAQTREPR